SLTVCLRLVTSVSSVAIVIRSLPTIAAEPSLTGLHAVTTRPAPKMTADTETSLRNTGNPFSHGRSRQVGEYRLDDFAAQASSSVSRSGCPPIGEVFALVRASYARPARTPSPGTGAAPQSGTPGTVFADRDRVTLARHNVPLPEQQHEASGRYRRSAQAGAGCRQAEGHGRKKRCHEGSGASSRMVR